MTVFYGSGRFCSSSCANSRQHSKETKDKISKSVCNAHKHGVYKGTYKRAFKGIFKRDISKNIISYERNPNRCTQCGKALSYNIRFRKLAQMNVYIILEVS